MLRKGSVFTFLINLSAWLMVAILAAIAILSFTNLASAQQSSILSAPVLTAQAEEGKIELSWTAVAGAARYELWTWTSADGWQQLDDSSLTGTTFSHTGLTVGVTYYYWVRAVNASGETSGWSERQAATVIAPSSNATPTHTATPTSTTSILLAPVLTAQTGKSGVELSWEAVAGAVRYELWSWTSADGWLRLDNGSLSDTSYIHMDVAVETTYYYAIQAVNNEGEISEWSEYVSLTWVAVSPTPSATPTVTPPVVTTDRGALVALYNATGGPNWRHSNNWLTDEPLSTWFGVTLDETGHVGELRVASNNLTGSLPDLSPLTRVRVLDFGSNNLTGPIPDLRLTIKSTGRAQTRVIRPEPKIMPKIPSPADQCRGFPSRLSLSARIGLASEIPS